MDLANIVNKVRALSSALIAEIVFDLLRYVHSYDYEPNVGHKTSPSGPSIAQPVKTYRHSED